MFLIFKSIKVMSHFLHAGSFITADRTIFFLNFICFHSSLDYLAASSFAILMYFDLIGFTMYLFCLLIIAVNFVISMTRLNLFYNKKLKF